MKLNSPISVTELATMINAELVGNDTNLCTGINEIHKVVNGDLTFVDFEKYYNKSLQSDATIIIINKKLEAPEGKTLLIHPEPFDAYVQLVKHFRPFVPSLTAISETSLIGADTVIMPNVFIGNHVEIGQNCIIHPNVTIYDHCVIGDNCIIHSGSVIGADAFYFKRKKERSIQYDKLESCGRVVIGDHVEIGASCTIDKGVSGDTVIGSGTKFDNQVHIGHGAIIGKNCLFAAQVGIGGKAIIEDEVILWGQVGVSKDLVIGKGAIVYAQSGVASSIDGGKVYFGSPVDEAREKMKELNYIKRLPLIWQELKSPKRTK